VTFHLSDLKPESYHAINIKEHGAANFQGAYHYPDINGEIYEPFGKRHGFLMEVKGDK
jgi:hypothetical protein